MLFPGLCWYPYAARSPPAPGLRTSSDKPDGTQPFGANVSFRGDGLAPRPGTEGKKRGDDFSGVF